MRRLLDTSVAIALRDRDARIRRLVAGLDVVPAMSILTVVELEGGIGMNVEGESSRRRAVDTMIDSMAVLDFGQAEARIYGEIIRSIGFTRSKVIDRMIAAQALAANVSLVTLNPRDFRNIPGLMIEDWTLPHE